MLRRRILPWSAVRVAAQSAGMLVVPLDEPVSLRAVQVRPPESQLCDLLTAGVVGQDLIRLHAGNVLEVIWTEVRDLRTGPFDEVNGLWQLVHRGAQQGDYLTAWVFNADYAERSVRGHFIVGDPT